MNEKKVLALTGAAGASCMATATVLMGADLADGINQTFKVVGFSLGAVGTLLSAGVAYYKGAIAGGAV